MGFGALPSRPHNSNFPSLASKNQVTQPPSPPTPAVCVLLALLGSGFCDGGVVVVVVGIVGVDVSVVVGVVVGTYFYLLIDAFHLLGSDMGNNSSCCGGERLKYKALPHDGQLRVGRERSCAFSGSCVWMVLCHL